MPFDAFVTYETAGRKVRGLNRTQAQANAAAAADADLTAHAGSVSVPDAAVPGYYFNPADLSFTPEAVLTELEQLKAEARLTHQQLGAWTELLSAAALTHLSAHVAYGHDILFHGHQAMYIVCRRTADPYTLAHRITYCQQMRLGASNVTDVPSFFQHVHSVASTPLPDGPASWVDPEYNVRKPFAEIPTSNMNHFPTANKPANVAPPPADLRDGAWIDDLAA